jgi:hypothetical protein
MNDLMKKAIQYIRNTGETATVAQFDDDHEPIGPSLREDIEKYFTVEGGVMKLTHLGRAVLGEGTAL